MIVHATGEPDSGKTRFVLQHAPIAKTAFFHDDIKELPKAVRENLGLYVDLVQETKGLKMLQLRDFILGKLEKIEPGQYEAIVFDTWTRTGRAFQYWGKLHANEFREAVTFSASGKMKAGEEWAEGRGYEAQVISDLSRLSPFVGLVTHLKDVYEGGAKTGQQMPDASRVFDRVCNFRVWLRHNADSGVPIALVLKRLAEDRVNEDGMLETVNIAPWKITPRPEDKSVWDTINWYRANPVGNRAATPAEMPNEYELSILTGIMTKDQRQIWQANLADKARGDDDGGLLTAEETAIKEFVNGLKGQPPAVILGKLQEQAKVEGWSRQEFDFGFVIGML